MFWKPAESVGFFCNVLKGGFKIIKFNHELTEKYLNFTKNHVLWQRRLIIH